MQKVIYEKRNKVNKRMMIDEMDAAEYVRVRPLALMTNMPQSAVKRLVSESEELAPYRQNINGVWFCEVGAFLELLNCPRDKDGNFVCPNMENLFDAAKQVGITYYRLQKACTQGLLPAVHAGKTRYINIKVLEDQIANRGGDYFAGRKNNGRLHTAG